MTLAPLNCHKWLVLLVLGLALSVRPIGCDYSGITKKFGAEAVARCNERCPFQNRTGDGNSDLTCGADCVMQQCTHGCSLWQQGLENSCQSMCNVTSETVLSRELYCVMGCNEALNSYLQKLRNLIGTPPAPALVADSLTATSLSLIWEMLTLGNLSYLVQWRYEELPGTWQYYSNISHTDRTNIHVKNLHPYTKYRFRVAIFLMGRGTVEPVYSAPSVTITTLEKGPPHSTPVSLRAIALDSTRVAISWLPGPFPNGPLISYVLTLNYTCPNGTLDTFILDMPASNSTFFYIFQHLIPGHEYSVSVAMRNAVGEGPRATTSALTPPQPTSVPVPQTVLILGGEKNVLAAPANDMLSDPIELYTTEHYIAGVGLDVLRDYLFVAVSNGYVYRSSLSKKGSSDVILNPITTSYKPHDLSVDWLNRHLYVLGEMNYGGVDDTHWEILRCDFEGKNQLVALSGFNSRPIHFEVDAYNGYLFWATKGVERGGLYRLDLANISNGVRHDSQPELIVRDPNLGAFAVDHADFRILVTHLRRNTVLAVSLDGREVTDFRNNTQTPMFLSARSIAYANGLFYWTNGKDMLSEEYHEKSNSYFHNEYPLMYHTKRISTQQVLAAVRSCQPIPVPVNPPINVQGVMGINRAKVSWNPPHLLGHQGSGAWQQWAYNLQLTHVPSGKMINRFNISNTFLVVENLDQDTEYNIRVAAVTESGSGPWSSEFVGKTLSATPATIQSTLLWSGPDGLLQTDLTGDNLQTLIHKAHFKDFHITDISWYRDMLYLVTNASTVMWYNTTSHEKGFMPNMDNVGSLAVDWVGKRIYWSNPKQQLITRGNLDGSNREPVPIVTIAKQLIIDSMNAYIYWSTGHALEAARLNGENKMVYYPAQLFSGKQVMGLAIDLDNKWLYWLVRSYDGSELHRAPTADHTTPGVNEVSASLVSRVPGTASLGPLCYFGDRLVWVQDGSRAVVADLRAQYAARLVERVHVLAVRDPTLHALSDSLVAIPESINSSSIRVIGIWNHFNVTWASVTRVNVKNSRVFYDVSLHFEGKHKIERSVEVPWLEVVSESIEPYSGAEVTVRAVTAWGGGAAARVQLHSPPAPPAPPTRLRLYRQLDHSGGPVNAIFRWERPKRPNGVVRGYEIQFWIEPLSTAQPHHFAPAPAPQQIRLGPALTQFVLRNLMTAHVYFFRVRAFTDAGYGEYSEIVSSSSDEINPVPKVMLSSQDSLKILDLDSGESITVPKSTGIPIDFAVSIEENIVYWVNNLEEIFSSRINGSGHYKLTSIDGRASSIGVDWVSRSIYWTQLENTPTESHVTYRIDISSSTTSQPLITRIFARKRPVHHLQIAPMLMSLFWYEEIEYPNLGRIMTSSLDGTYIRTFFKKSDSDRSRNHCNCSENPQVTGPLVVDMTSNEITLYWIDPWINRIVATDVDACICRTVVDITDKKKCEFSSITMTVDSKYIYWFNRTDQTIFYTHKQKKDKIEHIKLSQGYKIQALDSANQPYPPRECLLPKRQTLHPQVSKTANNITLKLPRVSKPDSCRNIDFKMPVTEYTALYRPFTSNDASICYKESCPYTMTSSMELVIRDLKPFLNYSVLLEATNYYARLQEVKPVVLSSMVIQTAAEPPTAPKNVTGVVVSPVQASVEWASEPDLSYELHWQTDNTYSNNKNETVKYWTIAVSGGGSANITHLSPGSAYTVWVRAVSAHTTQFADSERLHLRTPPPPAPLALATPTAYSLLVLWPNPTAYTLNKYEVQYIEARSKEDKWKFCTMLPRRGRGEWLASDLRPDTHYRFRLRLQYIPGGPPYYWPDNSQFTYLTLGDVPGPPGPLQVEAVGERAARVWWSEPDPRGAPITFYRVWGRRHHREELITDNVKNNVSEQVLKDLPTDISDEVKKIIVQEGLELLHNGTETYWLIGSEPGVERITGESGGYEARVQARNKYGWGALGPQAPLVAPLAPPPRPHPAALAATLALSAALCCVAAVLLCAYNNRRNKKAAALEAAAADTVPRRLPDVELATLRQLPIQHSNNVLYNQGIHCPTDAELAALPHIRREQITLTKFLGAGAFGEVFEGIARHIDPNAAASKVAVKTLRKGATEQEKTEFLKEAALMSNFKHEHILRLIGVCLDNDPNYIIMELMEGGDLLTYLRKERASLYTSASLSLRDVLSMCVDVTTGCRYLEEMHYVHRDLAARNCLVSHRAGTRTVKIGDFGLARDIYRNDYYRKKGEGMLPLRWMAVECLMDGVFSCQSDVWAWAVLCWEVLTLGQQPYPARTNHQVLEYVRAGGTPDRPPNCPTLFYELLQKCWSYNPEARPSFRQCLDVVRELRDNTPPSVPLTATTPAPHPYLTLLADPHDEDFPEHEMEPSRLLRPRTPKYLELMHDNDSGTVCDGYEVPRTPIVYAATRHSIVGVAPNRLIKPPLYRTHSLRTYTRPPNATIIPLRNGLVKRASLCEGFNGRTFLRGNNAGHVDDEDADNHVFKTPF